MEEGRVYKTNEKRRASNRRWRAANPEKVRDKRRAEHAANPEKARAQARRWRAANPEKVRTLDRLWKDANRVKVRASVMRDRYGMAAPFLANLFYEFQNGKDYITGEPLEEGFALDHDHSTDLVRGLLNDSTNRQLGQQCGDSIVGCRKRLLKLKNKDGKLGTFCKLTIDGLMHTPAVRMGLTYRVTGSRASLPESRTYRDRFEIVNMLAIRQYVEGREEGQTNAA